MLPASPAGAPHTLFDKVWSTHVVDQASDGTTLLYIDRHLLHEATSAQAFAGLRDAHLKTWRAQANIATPDHSVPTQDRQSPIEDRFARIQVDALTQNCKEFGVALLPLGDPRQGIVHVVGPELGATLPGMTIVCGDSHTSTHGAFAAIAHGIGTSEVEHVLATQTLLARKPQQMRVRFNGHLPTGVTAKDMALALIQKIGAAGASGHAIEHQGAAVSALSMEGRMTLCNLSIEAGARCAMAAVDETTIDYLRDRPMSPIGHAWDAASAYWRSLKSDALARFDQEVEIDVGSLKPLVTWGTSPEMSAAIDGTVPDPAAEFDPARRAALQRALDYMGLEPHMRLTDIAPNIIFIGSCSNSRIEDLRAAADVVRGRQIAKGIQRAMVVPGSGLVKLQAEREGLDRVFIAAGFEWREAGCSMCVGMNPDRISVGDRCAATSNRNFEDRQGIGGRVHLVSPAMAAAAAIAGHFVDVSADEHTWLPPAFNTPTPTTPLL